MRQRVLASVILTLIMVRQRVFISVILTLNIDEITHAFFCDFN